MFILRKGLFPLKLWHLFVISLRCFFQVSSVVQLFSSVPSVCCSVCAWISFGLFGLSDNKHAQRALNGCCMQVLCMFGFIFDSGEIPWIEVHTCILKENNLIYGFNYPFFNLFSLFVSCHRCWSYPVFSLCWSNLSHFGRRAGMWTFLNLDWVSAFSISFSLTHF